MLLVLSISRIPSVRASPPWLFCAPDMGALLRVQGDVRNGRFQFSGCFHMPGFQPSLYWKADLKASFLATVLFFARGCVAFLFILTPIRLVRRALIRKTKTMCDVQSLDARGKYRLTTIGT